MSVIWNNPDGLRVQFGTRFSGTEANFGSNGDVGAYKELVIDISATDFTAGSATYNGTTFVLPAGATIRESLTEVITAFTLAGTTPVINVGVSTTEGTNRVVQISQAQAQAVGVYNTSATAAGTLAVGTPLASQSTLNIALGGTTPTVTGQTGKLRVTVRYQDLTPAA